MAASGAGARLFDGYSEADLQRHPDFVIGRLLEEGDSHDLRRLAGRVPESRWRLWLEREGGLGLSERSRAFWSLLLATRAPEAPALRRQVWPL